MKLLSPLLIGIAIAAYTGVHAAEEPKSLEERVLEMERRLNGTPSSDAERAAQSKANEHALEEIKGMGLPDRALKEFAAKNPKATVSEWKAAYFMNKETVVMAIFYSDSSAKHAQQELYFRKQKGIWTVSWATPSILEKTTN